jgi:hypothetical protein
MYFPTRSTKYGNRKIRKYTKYFDGTKLFGVPSRFFTATPTTEYDKVEWGLIYTNLICEDKRVF